MRPNHNKRLTVAKPDLFSKRSAAESSHDIAAGSESEIISQTVEPESNSRNSYNSEISEDVSQAADGCLFIKEMLPPFAISGKGRLFKPAPMAESIKIVAIEEDDGPFTLGDLLSWKWVRQSSGMLLSFVIHLIAFILLSIVLFNVGTGKAMIVLKMLQDSDLDQEVGVLTKIELQGETDDLERLTNDGFGSSMFDEVAGERTILSALGSTAGVDKGGRKGRGDGKSAQFFGTKATGNSFVYVLDSSGSMGMGTRKKDELKISRFAIAKTELMDSINSLQPHQEFYVVLFSTRTRRMFDNRSTIVKPIKATDENKTRFEDWLKNIGAGGGTDPRESIKLALDMKPDAVFMLSDGAFDDEKNDAQPKTNQIVKNFGDEEEAVRINAIAFEDKNAKGNMKELADISGGEFRFVLAESYVDRLIESPIERVRLQAIEHLVQRGLKEKSSAEMAVEKLIPLLQSQSKDSRKTAETALHQLSFDLFADSIPSVAKGESTEADRKIAVQTWTDIWNQVRSTKPSEINNASLNRWITSGSDNEFLTALWNFSEIKDAVEQVDFQIIRNASPVRLIGLSHAMMQFQEQSDVAMPKRKLFLEIFLELNMHSSRGFSESYFLKSADLETCRERLKKVLRNRGSSARSLFRRWETSHRPLEERLEAAQKLIEVFPETKLASQVRSELKQQASERDAKLRENSALENSANIE